MDIQDITIALLTSSIVGSVYGALVAHIGTRASEEREVWLAYLNVIVVVGILLSLQTTIARHLGLILFFPVLLGVGLGFAVQHMFQHAIYKPLTGPSNDTDLSKRHALRQQRKQQYKTQ